VNTPTDDASQCVLHTCQCILSGTCGALNSPCCTATTPCTDAANECSASNGLCVPKGTGACTPGLKNGDFSAGLQYWNQTTLSGGGDVTINNSVSYNCLATQTGNPFAFENVYEAAVYLSQVFTVPTGATTLEMDAWNNLDPQDAIISVVLNGVETVLATVEPNAMQELSDPSNDYSVVCTGLPVSHLTYPIGAYAGKSVELRLGGAYVSGYNGTYISYDNVVVH